MSKRSDVKINSATGIVIKKILKWSDIVFPREVMWLDKFNNSKRFPQLLGYNESKGIIRMTYCGEMISKENCPPDWRDQIDDLLVELKKYNCSHNDIKKMEVLVHDGIIKLVDFGWATEIGEAIPSDWPENLGMEFRLAKHVFDDKHALNEIMKLILNEGK